jgi:hypothetical protein
MVIMGDVPGLPRPTSHCKRANPARSSSARVPLVERPPLLRCKTFDPPLSCLYPLMGCQHPMGSSAPWRSELIISPCVPIQNGTCSLGMILHINSDALHGLISHKDHSNVNHISSSIVLNRCNKSLRHQSKAQRHYTSLQYTFRGNDRVSYWASVPWKRRVSGRDLIQAM